MRASSDALSGPTPQGSYLAVELQNPTFSGSTYSATLAAYRRVSGAVTLAGSANVPCRSGMVVRAVWVDTLDQAVVYVDNVLYLTVPNSGQLTTGMPGVGARGTVTGNSIAQAQLGPLDRNAPTAV